MATSSRKRPGISKRIKPQRDAQGRFAAKTVDVIYEIPPFKDTPFTSFVGRKSIDDFLDQEPNWAKRVREWFGNRLIDAGLRVLGF